MLSERGQDAVRHIDQILIDESSERLGLYCFDVGTIAPLVEDEIDDGNDELGGLTEEKAQRVLGEFILHENFTDEYMENHEEQMEVWKNMGLIERIYEQDHDFFCCARPRLEEKGQEVDEVFGRGLEAYISGDWMQAQGLFFRCRELYGVAFKQYGWLMRMLELMEKSKASAPEAWPGAYDWDRKPTPPDDGECGDGDGDSDEDEEL